MPKKLCALLAFFCLFFGLCSCQAVSGLLDKAGAGDLKEKLDTAWSEVGKDALKNFADDIWREYGFGKSIGWPETGNGAHVPKFREGKIESAFISDGGRRGCLRIDGTDSAELEKYKTGLEDIGYQHTITASHFESIYTCDGLYIGFIKNEKTLYICYDESASGLDGIYETALVFQNQDE